MNKHTIDLNSGLRSIRCCPFCAGPAHVSFKGLNPFLYGVRCRNCGANLPAIHIRREDAIAAWNRRAGLASDGGKATRGIRTTRKLAAARRNLKKARQVRQMNRIRRASDAAYAALLPYRQAEIAEAEAAAERAWAELRPLEPQINKYPELKKLYEWVKERRQMSKSGRKLDGK